MIPSTTRSTLFPYTTLFRSGNGISGVISIVKSIKDGQQSGRSSKGRISRIKNIGMSKAGAGRARWHRESLVRIHWQMRSEEHTSELQSHSDLVCRLLLEKKK